MKDLMARYEEGVLAYKNKSFSEALRLFQILVEEEENSTDPDSRMFVGMALTMLARCHIELKRSQEAVVPLTTSAQIFYDLGAERHTGYVLPFCGSLMAENKPAVGLRTIYDGIHRLKSSGAPLKAMGIREAVDLIAQRVLTQVRFATDYMTPSWSMAGRMSALHTLGECLLLEGHQAAAIEPLQTVLEYYKSLVEEPQQTQIAQEMMDVHINLLDWELAHATLDEARADEAKDVANSRNEWLPWFPGPYTKFPDAPPCAVDLRKFPPFDFLSDLYIPFSTKENAAAYGSVGTEILGSYGSGIPRDVLEKARSLLTVSADIYKEHEDFHSAANVTVCLVEAVIRTDGQEAKITDLVNFVLQYLDTDIDGAMIQYLKSMVIGQPRYSEV